MCYLKLLEICKKYSDCHSFEVGEDINSLETIRKNFMVQSHERVIAFLDISVSSTRKEGLVVAEFGVYWKNTPSDDLVYLSYSEIKDMKVDSDDLLTTQVGDSYFFTGNKLLGRTSKHPAKLKKFLQSIQSIVKNGKVDSRELNRVCIQHEPSESLYFFLSHKQKREVKISLLLNEEDTILAFIKKINSPQKTPLIAICTDGLYIAETKRGDTNVTKVSWDMFVKAQIQLLNASTLSIGQETNLNITGIHIGENIGVHRLLNELIDLYKAEQTKAMKKNNGQKSNLKNKKNFSKNSNKQRQNSDLTRQQSKPVKNSKRDAMGQSVEKKTIQVDQSLVSEQNRANEKNLLSQNKYDVFISYASLEATVAYKICDALENRGVRCWIDKREIGSGELWPSKIVGAISECPIFLLLLSEKSNRSVQIQRELLNASDEESLIVPFYIEKVELSNFMKYFIRSLHWLDLMTEPFDQQMDYLATYIKKKLNEFSLGELSK